MRKTRTALRSCALCNSPDSTPQQRWRCRRKAGSRCAEGPRPRGRGKGDPAISKARARARQAAYRKTARGKAVQAKAEATRPARTRPGSAPGAEMQDKARAHGDEHGAEYIDFNRPRLAPGVAPEDIPLARVSPGGVLTVQ